MYPLPVVKIPNFDSKHVPCAVDLILAKKVDRIFLYVWSRLGLLLDKPTVSREDVKCTFFYENFKIIAMFREAAAELLKVRLNITFIFNVCILLPEYN
jgi:hypothetical protein